MEAIAPAAIDLYRIPSLALPMGPVDYVPMLHDIFLYLDHPLTRPFQCVKRLTPDPLWQTTQYSARAIPSRLHPLGRPL